MITYEVKASENCIALTPSTEFPEATLSEQDRSMLEAGFKYVHIPKDLPMVLGTNKSGTVSKLGETKFSSLKELELVLVQLGPGVSQINTTVGDNECRAFIPPIPKEVRSTYKDLKDKAKDMNTYILLMPEWDVLPKDPMLLVGNLEAGYLWSIGLWGGPEELQKLKQFIR